MRPGSRGIKVSRVSVLEEEEEEEKEKEGEGEKPASEGVTLKIALACPLRNSLRCFGPFNCLTQFSPFCSTATHRTPFILLARYDLGLAALHPFTYMQVRLPSRAPAAVRPRLRYGSLPNTMNTKHRTTTPRVCCSFFLDECIHGSHGFVCIWSQSEGSFKTASVILAGFVAGEIVQNLWVTYDCVSTAHQSIAAPLGCADPSRISSPEQIQEHQAIRAGRLSFTGGLFAGKDYGLVITLYEYAGGRCKISCKISVRSNRQETFAVSRPLGIVGSPE